MSQLHVCARRRHQNFIVRLSRVAVPVAFLVLPASTSAIACVATRSVLRLWHEMAWLSQVFQAVRGSIGSPGKVVVVAASGSLSSRPERQCSFARAVRTRRGQGNPWANG